MGGNLDMSLQGLGPDFTCPLFHNSERSDNTGSQFPFLIVYGEMTYSVPACPDFCSTALAFLSQIRAIIWTVFPRPISYLVSCQLHDRKQKTYIG